MTGLKLLDWTCATPAENLACDEALLDACEANGHADILRFWQADEAFVVLGYGNRTELESMVGYFINPLALRLDLSGDPTFTELIARTRETTLEAFAHADVPYESVVRATNPQRDLSDQ